MQNPYEHGIKLEDGLYIEAKHIPSIQIALDRWRGVETYEWVKENIDGAPEELPDDVYWEIADELHSEDYITGEDELRAVKTILQEHKYI